MKAEEAIEVLSKDLWPSADVMDAAIKTVLQELAAYREMCSQIDSVDFQSDFCIQRFRDLYDATDYDEDGSIIHKLFRRKSVLEAFNGIQRARAGDYSHIQDGSELTPSPKSDAALKQRAGSPEKSVDDPTHNVHTD